MLSTYLDAIEATGGDVLAASKALGIPESSLRSRIRREGLWERVEAIRYSAKTGPTVEDEDEGLTEENGVKVGVVQPDTPWSAEDVIRFYGDDPDECEILSKRGTFWGQPESPNHHLRVNWISKADLIQPADPGSWTPPPKPRKQKKTGEPRKVVICGDHHVPFHDRTLHQLFLEWLADEQPDEGDINGDLFDFAFKPHLRNLALLDRWREDPERTVRRTRLMLGVVPLSILLFAFVTLAIAIAGLVAIARWLA